MRGRSRKILIGIAIVVVGLGLAYGLALVRAMAQLRGAYAALKQDGRPMRAIDIVPPEVPEADNAAPLYVKAALLLKKQSAPKNKHLLEYLAGLASSSARDALEAEERTEFQELMAQEVARSALAMVEEALQRPECRFDHDYDNGLCKDVRAAQPTHHLMRRDTDSFAPQDLRRLGSIRTAHVYREVQAGRVTHAWEMVEAQFKLADALCREPVSDAHFSRFNIVRDLCRVIRTLCEIAPPDETCSRKIELLLADQTSVGPLVYALDAERLLRGEWLFSLPQDRLYEAMQRENSFSPSEGVVRTLSRLDFRFATFRPRLIADHACCLRMMHRCVQILEGPYMPFQSPPHRQFQGLAGHSLFPRKLAPMIQLEKRFHCGMVATVNLTRAGLALLRYRDARGTFPDSLAVLDLEGLIDPFTEAPVHYRTEDAGFIVYSVGEDQKDNNGTPYRAPEGSDPRRKMPEYDLVWRFSGTAGRTAGGDI